MNFQDPSNSLEWMVFLAKKYSSMFIEGTWLTLYIAVIGTLIGFVLGYVVGIIEDIKINQKECLIDIRIDAHIPETYIESLPQRLSIYKRIADIKTEEDASDVIDELIDRFGEPPAGVEGLVKVALLRNTAASMGIYEIGQNNNSLLLYVEEIDMQKVALLVKGMRGRILVSRGPKPYITVKKSSGQSPLDTLEETFNLLKRVI